MTKGRRLILPVGDGSLEAVLAKAADVITYVEHGVCVLGVVGKDTIMEHGSRFFEILDLGFGRCSFALAAPKGADFFGGYRVKTIATKYPKVARRFFQSRDMDVGIIKIEGSVELAPLLGLADGIVDIVETGHHLKGERPGGGGAGGGRVRQAHCQRRQLKAAQRGDRDFGGAAGSGHRRKKGTGVADDQDSAGRLADLPVLCGGPEKPGGRDLPGD